MYLYLIKQPGNVIDIITIRLINFLGKTVGSLLLCHALSGCGTTTGFFGFGKVRLLNEDVRELEKMYTVAGEFYVRTGNSQGF